MILTPIEEGLIVSLRKLSALALTFVLMIASISFADPVAKKATNQITIHKVQGSKVLSNLQTRLKNEKGNKKFPVIVSYKNNNQSQNMKVTQLKDASFSPTRVYKNLPAMAASLTKEQIQKLSTSSDVAQIEYDEVVKATSETANFWYGTESAREDFGLDGNRDGDPTHYSKDDIVVAIIDTGIDASHVDLDGGKVIGWNDLVNKKTTPYDDQGHGTHVASITAGSGDGNPDYKGVAPGAALVGVKVLDAQGSGSMSNVIAGIDWVISNKDKYNIRVINMSLGTPFSSDGTDTTSQAVNRAKDAGIVCCVAAGNSGPATSTVGAPGAATGALTVGATADPSQGGFNLAYFSSRGPTADGRIKPDIASPGYNITAAEANTGNGYIAHSGTSMATPFTAGTVALILDANPNLTTDQVFQIITSTARDFGPKGKDIDYGAGHLNGYAAIKAAGNFEGNGSPKLPGRIFGQGNIKSDGGKESWSFDVKSTDAPIGISFIMPDWQGFWFFDNMDFDIHLYDPSGKEVAKGEMGAKQSGKRQKTLSFKPTTTGKYKIQVVSNYGTGKYFFDISAFGSTLKKASKR